MVARPYSRDAAARLDDDSRSFVTENERKRLREVTIDHVKIARADAAGSDANQDLPFPRRRQVDVDDLDRPAQRSEDGCLCPHAGERIAPGP